MFDCVDTSGRSGICTIPTLLSVIEPKFGTLANEGSALRLRDPVREITRLTDVFGHVPSMVANEETSNTVQDASLEDAEQADNVVREPEVTAKVARLARFEVFPKALIWQLIRAR